MKKTKSILFSSILFLLTVFIIIISTQNGIRPENVIAQTTPPVGTVRLTGYAWSENIGWISFKEGGANSSNVVEVKADGSLVGYAWSEHIGWVQFGGLSNIPSTTGNPSINARIDGNSLVGWARAVVGISGVNTGGWDGWISLRGLSTTAAPYGVSVNGNNFGSYAWGSDVVGWIDFSGVSKITQAASCTGPGGITIADGSTYTYKNVSVDGTCIGDEQRSCSDGKLSGTFTTPGGCIIEPPVVPPVPKANCARAGKTVLHGQSAIFYTKSIAGITETCADLDDSLTCDDGTLEDSAGNPDTAHKFVRCINNPAFREN